MIELEVYWEDADGNTGRSTVYCIDSAADRFLVADMRGYFKFVPIENCEKVEDD